MYLAKAQAYAMSKPSLAQNYLDTARDHVRIARRKAGEMEREARAIVTADRLASRHESGE